MDIVPLKWQGDQISILYPVFQQGVFVRVRLGCSIRSLLCEQLGLTPDYVDDRIQTAFLNGKAVDDFDTAVVEEGAVLTLSGALPGLAGATLRRGGVFSPMRASLSHRDGPVHNDVGEGLITIRIFNILLHELAPVLLSHGIYVGKETVEEFMKKA